MAWLGAFVRLSWYYVGHLGRRTTNASNKQRATKATRCEAGHGGRSWRVGHQPCLASGRVKRCMQFRSAKRRGSHSRPSFHALHCFIVHAACCKAHFVSHTACCCTLRQDFAIEDLKLQTQRLKEGFDQFLQAPPPCPITLLLTVFRGFHANFPRKFPEFRSLWSGSLEAPRVRCRALSGARPPLGTSCAMRSRTGMAGACVQCGCVVEYRGAPWAWACACTVMTRMLTTTCVRVQVQRARARAVTCALRVHLCACPHHCTHAQGAGSRGSHPHDHQRGLR